MFGYNRTLLSGILREDIHEESDAVECNTASPDFRRKLLFTSSAVKESKKWIPWPRNMWENVASKRLGLLTKWQYFTSQKI
jgi:hypothetical protein